MLNAHEEPTTVWWGESLKIPTNTGHIGNSQHNECWQAKAPNTLPEDSQQQKGRRSSPVLYGKIGTVRVEALAAKYSNDTDNWNDFKTNM